MIPILSICCFILVQLGAARDICPLNWEPELTSTGATIECRPSESPSRCSAGSSCQESPDYAGVFSCCKEMLLCPFGRIPEVVASGEPKACQRSGDGTCGTGFDCEESPMDPGKFVCCASFHSDYCPDLRVPAFYKDFPDIPMACDLQDLNSCDSGYTCEQSPVFPDEFNCCKLKFCPEDRQPEFHKDYPDLLVDCSKQGNQQCSSGFVCERSPAYPEEYNCCKEPEGRVCPSGMSPEATPTRCSPELNTCKLPYSCQTSAGTMEGYCCTSGVIETTNNVNCPRVLKNLDCEFGRHPDPCSERVPGFRCKFSFLNGFKYRCCAP